MAKLDGLLRHLARCLGGVVVAVCLVATPSARAAALVTILDGEALLIEGAQALAAAEGLSLPDQTIIHTGPRTTLMRLEWPDGSVVDLGPDTRAMLGPSGFGPRDKRAPALYLLQGWAKQASADKGASAPGQVSLRYDLQAFNGVVVSFVGPEETWVFVESGSATLVERDAGATQRVGLRSGEVYQRSATNKGSVAPRPTPAQMQRVPRGFRDTLPHRADRFKDRKVDARVLAAPGYADLEVWLQAEPALRKEFPRRFASRAQDATFHAELVKRLGQHPEWTPVLYPDRLNKPAAATGRTP